MSKIITYQGSMDTLVWHKDRKNLTTDFEIIVPVSHEAIFVKDGQMTDSFSFGRHLFSECAYGEGHLFNHKDERVDAKVYYLKREGSYNIKWHTSSPIAFADPILKSTVSMELAGVFAIKIIDAKTFLRRLLTFTKKVNLDEVKDFFRERMILYIKDQLVAVMSENKLSSEDVCKNLISVSKLLELNMRYVFESFGVIVEAMNLQKACLAGSKCEQPQAVTDCDALPSVQADQSPEDSKEGDIKGEVMYCEKCGEGLPPLSSFCFKCGEKIEGNE